MVWRNKSNEGESLKVRFLPNGGFNKKGAFVEYRGDKPPEDAIQYERAGFLTLNIVCFDIELLRGARIYNELAHDDVVEPRDWRTIRAKGRIERSSYGQYSLSMLGSDASTCELTVSIREGEDAEGAFLSGYSEYGEFGEVGPDTFFVEAILKSGRFESILEALQQPDAQLRLLVRADQQRGFFAPWSPSVDEGRPVKFLDGKYASEKLVENHADIPELFWRQPEERSTAEKWSRADAEVYVICPIGSPSAAQCDGENGRS
ncbi:MAG: hypothetical protein ACOCYW_08990 [Roseicyclus sp.]